MLRRRVGKDGSRPAFTLIELLVVVAIIALLISILLPSLQRARELSKRSVCQSNLKGMGTSFYTYGNEFSDMWPICPGLKASVDGTAVLVYVQGTGNPATPTNFQSTIGYKRGTLGSPMAGEIFDTEPTASTTRNLWTLVRMQISPPKSFYCPSDTDAEGNADQNPQDLWDFGRESDVPSRTGNPTARTDYGYRQCSYGYQVPYGTKGKPSSDRDQRMPLAADRGPFSPVCESGKAWTKGTSIAVTGKTWSDAADTWLPYNSPNHGGFQTGEGQNVLYAGGSADWQGKPCVGIGYDNIYTSWVTGGVPPGGADADRVLGRPPSSYTGGSGLVTPVSDTDSMIYP